MPKKPQSGAQTAAQQQGSFLDSMPKKPQVRATNHAHAALAQLGERVWPGMWKIQVRVTARVWTGTTTLLSVLEDGLNNYSGFSSKRISQSLLLKTSVERNTYEFNLFLVGSAVWLSILSL
ncbi:hypothetical protein NQZ68_040750 [Dissostichus eleginoides]|nr:hypothetical protein NQZ68_040750 [Dissostichus eleginoides]